MTMLSSPFVFTPQERKNQPHHSPSQGRPSRTIACVRPRRLRQTPTGAEGSLVVKQKPDVQRLDDLFDDIEHAFV